MRRYKIFWNELKCKSDFEFTLFFKTLKIPYLTYSHTTKNLYPPPKKQKRYRRQIVSVQHCGLSYSSTSNPAPLSFPTVGKPTRGSRTMDTNTRLSITLKVFLTSKMARTLIQLKGHGSTSRTASRNTALVAQCSPVTLPNTSGRERIQQTPIASKSL
jgi:hypothetical protein